MSSVVYGPVPSWRLGRSLGVDLLSTPEKVCSFDCVYCQLGRTRTSLTWRKQFVDLPLLRAELEPLRGVAADYVTLSGVGEPTLASNLGEAILLIKDTLGLPVAVLTNSSFLPLQAVQEELALADVVVAKVDAPNEELFQQINRPFVDRTLSSIMDSIARFKRGYAGKLALQMMFIPANAHCGPEMAALARSVGADEVQVNTPLRPSPVRPLSWEELDAVAAHFEGLPTRCVYEAERPEVQPIDMQQTLRRRPRLY